MIQPVDSLEITVLVDHGTDSLSTNPWSVETEMAGAWRRGLNCGRPVSSPTRRTAGIDSPAAAEPQSRTRAWMQSKAWGAETNLGGDCRVETPTGASLDLGGHMRIAVLTFE